MKTGNIILLTFILCICITLSSVASYPPTDSINHSSKKREVLFITAGTAYIASLVGLNELWYKNNPRSSFHFFNDNHEWQLVDKVGHSFTSYQISRLSTTALQWAGLPTKKAYVYGGLSGILFMTPIEILDGFSAEYGASWGDLIANTGGAILYTSQQLLWQEAKIKPKFSFFPTPYAELRPNTLGSNFLQQSLKDYNGQTYWLSVDIYAFFKNQHSKFPKWLNFSVGYGAEEMIYALPAINKTKGFNTYRQFYLGPDIDLSYIKTNNRFLKALLYTLDAIHLPSPCVSYSKGKAKFHPIFF